MDAFFRPPQDEIQHTKAQRELVPCLFFELLCASLYKDLYKRMIYWLLLLYLFASTLSWSENTYYRFRVYLKDKGNQIYHIHQPEAFLSEAALARRNQQHIPISESDLPISAAYKQQLTNSGCTLITESRWLSTVVVEYPDSSLVENLKQIAFVDSVCWVWKGKHIPWQDPTSTET